MDLESLRKELSENGQEHLLQFWDTLDEEKKQSLYSDLKNLDYAKNNIYFKRCMESLKLAGEKLDDHLQPPPPEVCGSFLDTDKETLKKYEEDGLRLVSDNKIAVLLLAGGQGTRLGVNYPKGMYNVGLPSEKTLYQLQAERILKLQQLGKEVTGKEGIVPWYIMTSESTKEPTKAFFEKHNYFGLKEENVVFFEQYTLPCMSFDGKVILEKPHKVARAPDGNGGLYKALGSRGVMDDLVKRGIKYVHVYCVDNILVKMADPIFIGFCISKGAICGAKVVKKAFPKEAVGVVCKVDGQYQVVEYSEITPSTAEKKNPNGTLMFNAGNICNHFFTVDFLQYVVKDHQDELEHHVAKKKIPTIDVSGNPVKPTEPNGIKMEKFVFDVFKFASDSNFAVWEVPREDDFSPLKNADGQPKDTPTTCREHLYNLHTRNIQAAGGKFCKKDGTLISNIPSITNGTNGVQNDGSGDHDNEAMVVEVSPLVSYAGEGLEKLVAGKSFVPPLSIYAPGEKDQEIVCALIK
ncbi:UDP-N-acetylhexosamine pyrophosphorylase isoform X1 [Lingula anatina]|uniref:UDP-N-acetylglucosamine diphosphorylase n=1 Tax=Lingula anatina TaxID=7574 RepID=A0A1S3JGJ9_LINAN|nr:UDP-N-acetylhexosamine pyrophosphorylase isoform X1 [Lingula anatina]XP_013409537.1 UDP-N-acetylhexosamine pyrophosphorylase isoform X1 [Lingula anatina]XP_013409538.1 UDP-N-acetylhexosamine pyrophosphorylase isoform X1 [Lingula anatina]XP_013409539.1 UDP-N-acetylhexosamine pyrophosphorylase isoform X2 [Lingula anatina]XP_023931468.1 UDP-N-acetylhexosamine pyrophosphorylase isoform X1 [Lingula anatina]|eukprot:XP_013409535.1 UDP-N-acetylhexosamine pyrophosphorylase isoform X1 [Lingula anatina]